MIANRALLCFTRVTNIKRSRHFYDTLHQFRIANPNTHQTGASPDCRGLTKMANEMTKRKVLFLDIDNCVRLQSSR
jgi:hypothetical protein